MKLLQMAFLNTLSWKKIIVHLFNFAEFRSLGPQWQFVSLGRKLAHCGQVALAHCGLVAPAATYRSGSTFALAMACCLTVPSLY